MTSKPILILVYALLIAIFASCGGVTQKDCSDEKIVEDIKAKIKADPELTGQIRTINVMAEGGYVEIIGWTTDEKSWNRVKTLVTGTECIVGKPKYSRFLKQKPPEGYYMRPSPGGSCVPGTKPCVDLCIPEGERCNIKATD